AGERSRPWSLPFIQKRRVALIEAPEKPLQLRDGLVRIALGDCLHVGEDRRLHPEGRIGGRDLSPNPGLQPQRGLQVPRLGQNRSRRRIRSVGSVSVPMITTMSREPKRAWSSSIASATYRAVSAYEQNTATFEASVRSRMVASASSLGSESAISLSKVADS